MILLRYYIEICTSHHWFKFCHLLLYIRKTSETINLLHATSFSCMISRSHALPTSSPTQGSSQIVRQRNSLAPESVVWGVQCVSLPSLISTTRTETKSKFVFRKCESWTKWAKHGNGDEHDFGDNGLGPWPGQGRKQCRLDVAQVFANVELWPRLPWQWLRRLGDCEKDRSGWLGRHRCR